MHPFIEGMKQGYNDEVTRQSEKFGMSRTSYEVINALTWLAIIYVVRRCFRLVNPFARRNPK